jgi:phenylacetate-coenzyme A ligase PaaK-like adenylate-forming protein
MERRRTAAEAVIAEARIEERLLELGASERRSSKERAVWQEERLEAMLGQLLQTPFGRRHLDGVSRFEDLPPMLRSTLQREGGLLRAGDGGDLTVKKQTSGSTGRPVVVEHGPATIGYAAAARLRQLTWFGLPPREHSQANIRIASLPDDPPVWLDREKPPLFWVNPYALDTETIVDVHRILVEAGGVRLLGAESSMLERWAGLCLEAGVDGRELGAGLAILGGEMTFEHQRELGRQVFGCPVAEMYGSHECPMIATECAQGSLHVNEEVALVEILDSRGHPVKDGEWGLVHVSLLHNWEMPLLRYRLGDTAAWREGCPCGRTLRALQVGVGREEEMVRCRDGRLLHPRFIRTILERVWADGLRSFHTMQTAPGEFKIEVEAEGGPPHTVRADIERDLSRYLGEPASVTLLPASQAVRTSSGKLRTFTYAPDSGRPPPAGDRA